MSKPETLRSRIIGEIARREGITRKEAARRKYLTTTSSGWGRPQQIQVLVGKARRDGFSVEYEFQILD